MTPFAPRLAVLASALALLGACETIRDVTGQNKRAPDEFQVVRQAPLVLPPDYSLRPPQPGTARPQELQPRDQARAALGGRGTPTRGSAAVGATAGESNLLTQAKATDPDPDIRRKVNEEFTQLSDRGSGFVDRLMFWRKPADPTGPAVDPARESQRIREAQASGAAPAGEGVPTIQRRQRGLLEGLF
jgi:hypothetical protein